MATPDYVPPETGRPSPESPAAERRRLLAEGVAGKYVPAPRVPSAPLSPETLATLDALEAYGGPKAPARDAGSGLPKFAVKPARGEGFVLASLANGNPPLMPDGVNPIRFPDRDAAERFALSTEAAFRRHAATPPTEPDLLRCVQTAAEYYGYTLADFTDPPAADPEDAPTPEPFPLVPPDLTHALAELVMLYGPDLVKLAAARY